MGKLRLSERVPSHTGLFGALSLICRILLAAATAGGCVPETVFLEIVGADNQPPVFTGVKATEANQLQFRFSETVTVVSLRFSPALTISDLSDSADLVSVAFPEPLAPGGLYTADLVVEDVEGNGLNLLAPFRGRNNRTPKLRLMEIRTEYSKPKVEFVELVADSAGSLGGIRLVSASQGFDTPIFEFPPCDVRAGERIVVHLRTLDEGSVDETTILDQSAGPEASSAARDFWVPDSRKLIRKTDAVAVLDQDDKVLDAVLLSESAESGWKTESLLAAAATLLRTAAWHGKSMTSLEPADAVGSAVLTTTRTLCRIENTADTNGPGDWYICATSAASPGQPNNAARYDPAAKAGTKTRK